MALNFLAQQLLPTILEPKPINFSQDSKYYCEENADSRSLIKKNYIADIADDIVIIGTSLTGLLYFIYVIKRVRQTSINFFDRPMFLSWLPVSFLVSFIITIIGETFQTIEDIQRQGKELC